MNNILDDWLKIEQERIEKERILMQEFITECHECLAHSRWT